MALQPEIRTDSLAGQLSDSLPTTETALRESIFRLRDSLATIPPDTLQATPPVTAEELFGAGSTLAIEPFPTQSVRPIYARIETIYNHIHDEEVGIVPRVFNGIPDVQLVCLEKYRLI